MSEQETSFRAPRGTYDLLPPASLEWRHVMGLAMDVFALSGYDPVETPIFEHTEVFERGVGEATEVVGKQMYTFTDRGDRSLTLRPEGTAPVVRAVLEHNLHRGPLPLKLAYAGPMFRQERPQKGRYRQFWQVGIEAIGVDAAALDAEVIELGQRFLRDCGVETTLLLNSIGHLDPDCRGGYLAELRRFLQARRDDLAEDDRDRVDRNPLRTFDSKERATVAVMKDAPLITDHLCADCDAHFAAVRALLGDLEVPYVLEPRLVRGLDYYTRTAFEFVSGELGSQNAVGGGGRYDGLAESLGGDALPGIGFALGIDRIVIARGTHEVPRRVHVYVVAVGDETAARAALKLATQLRRAGIGADLDLAGRSMKGQMKQASGSGARWAAILGERELASGKATLKDLTTSDQREVDVDQVAEVVRP
ncbi:MAG TPA: histidine--tRNA ligase [Actinomycetota bacterium]|nr:histidine--tRNA ligase [Actinomycetota bacterium]